MLEPARRRLFLETLRPPDGYLLDRAVGTTFTLDLMALLSVPLAFTFRDAQDGDGQLATEPLSLLESARRYAGRIVVFSQGGYTGVPRADQPALAFIEESLVTVFPPARSELGAIFHPKVWALRYVPSEGTGDQPVRYRLVSQSRNLTFDSSWDVSLVLDGDLNESRVNAYSFNRPLADFVERLPSLSPGPLSSFQQESIDVLSDELLRVHWDPPAGLQLNRFLPFGLRRANPPYPDLERRRLLVISPFLDGEFLRSITRRRRRSVLVSRREALLTASPDAIRSFEKVYAFRSGLEPEPEDTEESIPLLAGLHAKVFVIDDGWNARVAVGSANSTAAALGNPPRNVEFLVELVGRKSRFGIDALLGADQEGEPGTFSSLIEKFDPEEVGTETEDEDQLRLNRLLDGAAQTLARVDLGGSCASTDCSTERPRPWHASTSAGQWQSRTADDTGSAWKLPRCPILVRRLRMSSAGPRPFPPPMDSRSRWALSLADSRLPSCRHSWRSRSGPPWRERTHTGDSLAPSGYPGFPRTVSRG